MNVTTKQATFGLAVLLLTLLIIAVALLCWQHNLGTQASLLSGMMQPIGPATQGC